MQGKATAAHSTAIGPPFHILITTSCNSPLPRRSKRPCRSCHGTPPAPPSRPGGVACPLARLRRTARGRRGGSTRCWGSRGAKAGVGWHLGQRLGCLRGLQEGRWGVQGRSHRNRSPRVSSRATPSPPAALMVRCRACGAVATTRRAPGSAASTPRWCRGEDLFCMGWSGRRVDVNKTPLTLTHFHPHPHPHPLTPPPLTHTLIPRPVPRNARLRATSQAPRAATSGRTTSTPRECCNRSSLAHLTQPVCQGLLRSRKQGRRWRRAGVRHCMGREMGLGRWGAGGVRRGRGPGADCRSRCGRRWGDTVGRWRGQRAVLDVCRGCLQLCWCVCARCRCDSISGTKRVGGIQKRCKIRNAPAGPCSGGAVAII